MYRHEEHAATVELSLSAHQHHYCAKTGNLSNLSSVLEKSKALRTGRVL